jgi:hypothetical protein
LNGAWRREERFVGQEEKGGKKRFQSRKTLNIHGLTESARGAGLRDKQTTIKMAVISKNMFPTTTSPETSRLRFIFKAKFGIKK